MTPGEPAVSLPCTLIVGARERPRRLVEALLMPGCELGLGA